MISEPEEWRAVVGFPDYEVSNHGRVRSLDRIKVYYREGVRVSRRHRGRILRAGTMQSGHQFVELGKGNGRCVHVLVLQAFVGEAPPDHECCHWDDDPGNNRLENLRWGTRSENLADYKRNRGRFQQQRRAAA